MSSWTRALAVTLIIVGWGASVGAQMGAISVTARGSQEWEGDIWHARDEVVITYQDVTIRCDEVELNRATGDVLARGQVIMDKGPQRSTADELRYNLKTKIGSFVNVTGSAPPSYSFTGALLEQLDETHYRIEDGTFTSCEQQDRPPWDLHLREAVIEQEGYGHFKGVAFRVKRIPTLYLPYLLWPMKMERAAGLLVPAIGYSDRRGFYLGTQVFVPFGQSYDTTIRFDYFSKGYYGLGTEFRAAPVAGAYGELHPYVIRDPVAGVLQWKVDGTYQQEDLLGFHMLAELHELSDNDFFREFEADFQQNTRRLLYSQIFMTRTQGPANLNLRVDRRVTFLTVNDVVLQQLPEVEYRVRSNRIGHSLVYWSLVSSANVFNVDRGGELKNTYGRADLFPQVSYTLPGSPWLTITPNLGARGTWYSSRYTENRRAFEDEPITRTYFKAGVDIVGPSFSKIFDTNNAKGTRYKHLIEPRIIYRYLPEPNEEAAYVPLFDEVDSVIDVNRVAVTLSNRLFMKSNKTFGAREVASLDLIQEYSFRDPLSYGAEGATSQKGPFGVALRIVPVVGTTLDARASFDTLSKDLRSTSLSASTFRSTFNAGLTWYEGFSALTGEKTSSQAQVRFGLRKPDFPVTVNLHVAYDIEKGLLQQQRYGLGYEGSCWGVRLQWRDLQSTTYPVKEWSVVISLKGIGELPTIKGTIY